MDEVFKKHKGKMVTIIVGIMVIIFGLSAVHIVPVNSVGIKYSDVTGKIRKEPLSSGMHFKIPIVDKITDVSTELRVADIDNMQITSSDSQEVFIDIEMQYRVLHEDAYETFKQFRSTPEDQWVSSFAYQRIQRGVQDAASDYTVIELMGTKRGEFQAKVDETVKEALLSNHLTVNTVSVDDVQVSETIRKSIEDNARAKQDVETARQRKAKQEVENETKIEAATAEAEVKTINAEAEANANKKLSEGITPTLVNYLEAQAREKHGWYLYNNMEPSVMVEQEKQKPEPKPEPEPAPVEESGE